MPDLLPIAERLAPRQRPGESPIGYHRWHDLLFVHWRVPLSVLQPLVPAGLEIDTWDGDAWLGVVAFDMTGVRPWWSPPVPSVSAFHETNLRTYVHAGGQAPGVYFLSLEAASSLAVRVARWRWNLPYFRARMTIRRDGQRISYTSRRLWPKPPGAATDLEAEIGGAVGEPETSFVGRSVTPSCGHATPGTLEFFLIERYLLYNISPTGDLLRGQVHHAPYPLRSARLLRCHETLSQAAGIGRLTEDQPACHAIFSPGVRVEIFPLRPVRFGGR